MLNWLIKRSVEKRFKEVDIILKHSFSRIKEDIEKTSQWIHYFKVHQESHEKILDAHKKSLELLSQRIETIEEKRRKTKWKDNQSSLLSELPEEEIDKWELLSETQQKLAWILLRLDKEKPNSWHSITKLAMETYPDKDYQRVRTTILQYLNILEELDYLEKKRDGKRVVVRTKKKVLPNIRLEESETIRKSPDYRRNK